MTVVKETKLKSWLIALLQSLFVPLGALLLAAVVGAVIMVLSGYNPLIAYAAMVEGAFGNMFVLGETLEITTPLIFTGLAVAWAFRGKLFNIGAEGQFLMGAIAATWVGVNVPLPPVIHPIACMAAGVIVGGLWGGLAGLFKAWRGVHEVISTIMLNFIAIFFIDWLVTGPMIEAGGNPQTDPILETARLAKIMPPSRLSLGIFVAVLVATFIWWLLWKTTVGYELRAVGLNLFAAEFAGIKPRFSQFTTMLLSGGLAGLGGAVIITGLFFRFFQGYNPGYGFDGIAVALVGGNNPPGVILAAFIFGALRQGATGMQSLAGVPQDLSEIMQALVIFFVAAPQIVYVVAKWFTKEEPEVEVSSEMPQLEGGQL